METVTIAASRGFTVADMEMLVGSAVIVAVLGLDGVLEDETVAWPPSGRTPRLVRRVKNDE